MGQEFVKRPLGAAGEVDRVTAVSASGAGGTLAGFGTTVITSASTAGSNIFHLPDPVVKGQVKRLVVSVGTTDAVDVLVSATTTRTIFGATGNALRFSTGANKLNGATLVAVSTSGNARWGVTAAGAGVTIVASTGV